MKRILSLVLLGFSCAVLLAACGGGSGGGSQDAGDSPAVVGDGSDSPVLFMGDGSGFGYEPHVMIDGVPTLLADIYAGVSNSGYTPFPLDSAYYNGKHYFRANDGTNSNELWASDGTPAGTAMVKDICAGAGNAHPRSFTVYNGLLYFRANDGIHGGELWVSDGTEGGHHSLQRYQSRCIRW